MQRLFLYSVIYQREEENKNVTIPDLEILYSKGFTVKGKDKT